MRFFELNGELYTEDLPVSSAGNFFAEKLGSSYHIKPDEPTSCFGFIVLNGVPTYTSPMVCEMCEHYMDCYVMKGEEEKEFKRDPGVDLIPPLERFDVAGFKSANTQQHGVTGNPEDFNW